MESTGGLAVSSNPYLETASIFQGPGGDAIAHPCRFQKDRDVRQKTETRAGAKQVEGSHTVNLMQNGPRRSRNTPLTSVVIVDQVSLKATLNIGMCISG